MMPKMKDMARTHEEMMKSSPMVANYAEQPAYPYGLCLRMDHDTLEKLGLLECVQSGECEPGDFIHVFALAKVTHVAKNDTGEGEKCCVELQITHMGCEDEDGENKEADQRLRHGR